MGIVGSIIDWEALLDSTAASLVAGVGTAIAFALAVYGAARFADARRTGAAPTAGGAAALSIVALAACAAAIAAGIVIIISDRS